MKRSKELIIEIIVYRDLIDSKNNPKEQMSGPFLAPFSFVASLLSLVQSVRTVLSSVCSPLAPRPD